MLLTFRSIVPALAFLLYQCTEVGGCDSCCVLCIFASTALCLGVTMSNQLMNCVMERERERGDREEVASAFVGSLSQIGFEKVFSGDGY